MKYFYVFVYGTLMKGGRNDRYLENAEYVKDYTLEGYKLFNVGSGGFPAIVLGKGTDKIEGEIYRVNANELKDIDGLEGYSSKSPNRGMYKRESIKMKFSGFFSSQLFFYVWNSYRSVLRPYDGIGKWKEIDFNWEVEEVEYEI